MVALITADHTVSRTRMIKNGNHAHFSRKQYRLALWRVIAQPAVPSDEAQSPHLREVHDHHQQEIAGQAEETRFRPGHLVRHRGNVGTDSL